MTVRELIERLGRVQDDEVIVFNEVGEPRTAEIVGTAGDRRAAILPGPIVIGRR